MAQKHTSLSEGFVLHSRPYRDTSIIVDFFSRDCGRMSVIGKGVRRTSSKFHGVLQPFGMVLLSWRGNTGLKTLVSAESVGAPALLTGPSLISGFYINELLIRLLATLDPHELLFDSYCQCLERLSESVTVDVTLRVFERELLQSLGYGLCLELANGSTDAIEPDAWYCYDPERGFSRINQKAPLHRERGLFKGHSILAMIAEDIGTKEARRDLKRLHQLALAPHLGTRPLRSRELFYRGQRRAALDESR